MSSSLATYAWYWGPSGNLSDISAPWESDLEEPVLRGRFSSFHSGMLEIYEWWVLRSAFRLCLDLAYKKWNKEGGKYRTIIFIVFLKIKLYMYKDLWDLEIFESIKWGLFIPHSFNKYFLTIHPVSGTSYLSSLKKLCNSISLSYSFTLNLKV